MPLNRPAKVPTKTPKHIAPPTGSLCSRQAAITAVLRPTMEPTDISISPVMMIKVIGSAMIAVGVMPAKGIDRLEELRKYLDTEAPQKKVAIRKQRRNASQRANTPVLWLLF